MSCIAGSGFGLVVCISKCTYMILCYLNQPFRFYASQVDVPSDASHTLHVKIIQFIIYTRNPDSLHVLAIQTNSVTIQSRRRVLELPKYPNIKLYISRREETSSSIHSGPPD